MERPVIIGVMGGGDADRVAVENAYLLGSLIAKQGWYLLNGGREAGVMDASAKGACENGGMTIGILPGETLSGVSPYIKVPIRTGIGMARNWINVLSSDVVVACPGGPGTLSEIALALKAGRPVITLGFEIEGLACLKSGERSIFHARTPEDAIRIIRKILQKPLTRKD